MGFNSGFKGLRLYSIQEGFCTEAMDRSPVDGGVDGT